MDEGGKSILQNSTRLIGKLQLLSVNFEDELTVNIYIRTQVIHRLFEHNEELDIHKLELFHLQFTQSIIDLLKKVKRSNENAYQSMLDEMEANEELIRKLSNSMREEGNFDYEKEVQAKRIDAILAGLFQNFSDYSKDNPVPKDIAAFGKRFAATHFYPLPDAAVAPLLDYDLSNVYQNGYGVVEKKLMGLECKHEFQNRFFCGIKTENLLLEVYQLPGEAGFFLFYPERKLFLLCPATIMDEIQVSPELSAKAKLLEELTEKNLLLNEQSKLVRKRLQPEVRTLLNDYYNKIAGMDYLNMIDSYDIQANILKTMLNTDSM